MIAAPRGANPLCCLGELGQSVWLDDISRPMLDDGGLARLIAEDCVSGLTSNPVIFERAVRESAAYDADIATMATNRAAIPQIYERLIVDDLRRAADLFRPRYDETEGGDGYVSIEVSPHLARDTAGTVTEAERLWRAIERPNAMIKVPGTVEGLPAIRTLIARGINVNVTLLFSPERYRAVAEAFVAGLEDRGRPPWPRSVASFFLSRIDTMIDEELDRRGIAGSPRGETAIALARVAYSHFGEWTAGNRWRALAAKGAAPQRLLWASTGTKDKRFSDVKYIELLVAPDTVTTMPLATLAAFRDHGVAEPIAAVGASDDFDAVSASLAAAGIDLPDSLRRLEDEGIAKFNAPFDALLAALAAKVAAST